MSETKWTNGPWDIDKSWHTYYIQVDENDYIAECPTMVDGELDLDDQDQEILSEARANAHLIAAAPELYEVLADLVRDHNQPLDADTTKYFVEQARAALAKARGE